MGGSTVPLGIPTQPMASACATESQSKALTVSRSWWRHHIWRWSHEMWCYFFMIQPQRSMSHESTRFNSVVIQISLENGPAMSWLILKKLPTQLQSQMKIGAHGPPPSHQFAEHTSPGENHWDHMTWPSELPQLGTHLSRNANTRSTSSTALPAAPNKNWGTRKLAIFITNMNIYVHISLDLGLWLLPMFGTCAVNHGQPDC